MLSLAVHVPDRAVRPQPRRLEQPTSDRAAFRASSRCTRTTTSRVWLQRAGYYTALVGKYLNEYENKPPVPPGWSEWHAVAPDPYRPYDYTTNDNGELTRHGERPRDYEQDVLTRKAVDVVQRRAPKSQPFFLWLTYSAPHSGGPYTDPNPPTNCDDAPKPPPRYAHAFDSEPLPRPPNFDEPDVSDKPAAIRKRPA